MAVEDLWLGIAEAIPLCQGCRSVFRQCPIGEPCAGFSAIRHGNGAGNPLDLL